MTKNEHDTIDKFEYFKSLYKKFINGTDWLNKKMANGINIEQDKQEFLSSVVEPMDALRATFTDEEKDYWSKVEEGIKMFGGAII